MWLLEQGCSYSFTSYSLEVVNLTVKLKKKKQQTETTTHCSRKQNISQLEMGSGATSNLSPPKAPPQATLYFSP